MIKRWMGYSVLMILIIVNINNICAESIDLNFPGNVVVGEEFDINLTFSGFNEDVYSVKIDIKNDSNYLNQRFWDNEWYQNRWMYNATNTSKSESSIFKLKISEDFEGSADLIVKIKSEDYSESVFIGYIININLPPSNNDSDSNETLDPVLEIYFDFEWDEDDIINTNNFEVDVEGFNLEDEKYDIKVWIENDEDEIISEIYSEEDDKWKSGQYYIHEILKGIGNDKDRIELRLKDNYKDFIGNADIFIKIRNEGNDVIYEDDDNINILENEEGEPEEDTSGNSADLMERAMELRRQMTGQNSTENKQVIRLGSASNSNNQESEDIKSKNSIIYESGIEKIKKYSVLGFAFLCMMLSTLLIKEKL